LPSHWYHLTHRSQFDSVVATYQSLSTRVLRTLHLSIRSTILYSLHANIRPTINIDLQLGDPDPSILALNASIVSFDTEVSAYIPPTTYPLITRGLAALMDMTLFSLCMSRIEAMNTNGCSLMHLNKLVLQQNLKNIENGADLPLVTFFLDLFKAGPEAIVARAREYPKSGFGLEGAAGAMMTEATVKRLLHLAYGERLSDERREAVVQAQRQLDAQLLELSEIMY
jgi:exocyst complex component 4